MTILLGGAKMYAIIETGGKQVKVEVGQTIYVEKIEGEVNSEVTFDKVLLVSGDKLKVGAPYVKDATVTASIDKQGKEKKVLVFKYKSKANYRRLSGHRQPYTRLKPSMLNYR